MGRVEDEFKAMGVYISTVPSEIIGGQTNMKEKASKVAHRRLDRMPLFFARFTII